MTIKLVGVLSNRSAIGGKLKLITSEGTQVDEVRGGGSYYSQNDLRVNFGLGAVSRVDRLEVDVLVDDEAIAGFRQLPGT